VWCTGLGGWQPAEAFFVRLGKMVPIHQVVVHHVESGLGVTPYSGIVDLCQSSLNTSRLPQH
jgi:hypothetical protein